MRRSVLLVARIGLVLGLATIFDAGASAVEIAPAAAAVEPVGHSPLRGPWQVKEMVSEGTATPASDLKRTRMIFGDKTFRVRGGAKTVALMDYKVDPTAKPAAIDITSEGETSLGVYRFAKGRLEIAWNEPTKPRPATTDEKTDGRVVLAPMGNCIDVIRVNAQGGPAVGGDAGKPTPFVDDLLFVNGGSPEWSRDGRRLAFDGWKSGRGEGSQLAHLLVRDLDARDPMDSETLKDLGIGAMPTWSPDGKQIGYSSYEPRGVWRMNADGTNRTLIDAEGWAIEWCPKGNKVAYTVGGDICVRDLDKKTTAMLLDEPYDYVQYGMSWSPDGEWVCFKGVRGESYDLAIVHVGGQKKGFRVLLSHDSSQTRQPAFSQNPSWSPDSKHVLVSLRPAGERYQQLHLLDAQGKAKPKRLDWQQADREYGIPAWSSDGKHLAFFRARRTPE